MRKYILLFLFTNFYLVAYNQVIKGAVLDKQTISTISFAAVYFSGTFVGTASDQDGNFVLDITKYTSMPLTISAVGYYSFTLTDFSTDEPYMIYLTPKVYEIKQVSIGAKSLVRERKANLKLFKKEFLGTSYNGKKCEIINEDDITFNYGSDVDTLKAFALNPIQIYNTALGYHITYFLDKFEFDKKNKITSFNGNIIVNEDLTLDETNKQSYERRRIRAYLGSYMHFFRTLWADDLRSTFFIIENSAGEGLKYKDVVIQGDNNNKYLRYTQNLNIYYHSDRSNICFLKQQVLFDQNGFFEASGTLWRGKMTLKRIADWLPYNYSVGY